MKIFILAQLARFNLFIAKLFQSFVSIFKIIIFSRKMLIFKKNINLNKKELKCILAMNGPSLMKDLDENSWIYDEKNILCVNNISTNKVYENLKPNYYLISDPAYWDNSPGDFLINYRKNIYRCIEKKTNWKMNFLAPSQSIKYLKRMKIFKNENIIYAQYNQTPIEGFKLFREILYSLNLGMPTPNNVLIPALICSLNLGFKEIFIIGADHSMFKNIYVNIENKLHKQGEHFYGKGKSRILYSYKYINGYVNDSTPLRMSEFLDSAASVFTSHETIKQYSNFKKAQIFNLTKNSYIDSYDRR